SSQSINVYQMTGLLTDSQGIPQNLTKNFPVPQYYEPGGVPTQPENKKVPIIPQEMQKAAEWNNTLVAVHTAGLDPQVQQDGTQKATRDVAQWYAINVSTGTPTLTANGQVDPRVGDINGNPPTDAHAYNPSIDINRAGIIGINYLRSGRDTLPDTNKPDYMA